MGFSSAYSITCLYFIMHRCTVIVFELFVIFFNEAKAIRKMAIFSVLGAPYASPPLCPIGKTSATSMSVYTCIQSL